VYELPEDLRNRLHQAIMTKCQHHKSGKKSST
jgi:hypothetical protein